MEINIDAKGLNYKDLNVKIRNTIKEGFREINILNVNGQRYIGDGLENEVKISIQGVPGNDLGAFMNGPTIVVNANAQDGVCNTMNNGKVVVHGDAGDVLGYSMRGGKLFVKGNVGYRVGIHMKSYENQYPVIIIGGTAGDFLGEYMAGGLLIVLQLEKTYSKYQIGDYIGTGIHGGKIYIRGRVDSHLLGKEIMISEMDDSDFSLLRNLIGEFSCEFDLNSDFIINKEYTKLIPSSHRPYGNLYAY